MRTLNGMQVCPRWHRSLVGLVECHGELGFAKKADRLVWKDANAARGSDESVRGGVQGALGCYTRPDILSAHAHTESTLSIGDFCSAVRIRCATSAVGR